ncbi:MAG TPA: histidine kinase [Croceibacterium sp.]|nr:histidine kinase [Croceibacterium sp.]
MDCIVQSIHTPHPPDRTQTAIRRDERHRIARELHDSVSQLLVTLQLNLACLKVSSENAETHQLFCALDQTLHELHCAVRAVSTSLETPSLQESLPLALTAMARQFGLLADLKVTLDMQENYVSHASGVEMSLYRIAQEALANVARHAHATEVRVQLGCDKDGTLTLEIDDDGVGFESRRESDPSQIGTGIENIRERVRDMGGHLILRRLLHGSQVAVTIHASTLPVPALA